MTFPLSPFPRCTQRDSESVNGLKCTAWDCRSHRHRSGGFVCAEHGDEFHRGKTCPACRFPILRSSPLWRQTWISVPRLAHSLQDVYTAKYDESDRSGCWFPPLDCGGNGIEAARWNFVIVQPRYPAPRLFRLFSSPSCRCPECLSNAQTIEIMLVGIAYELSQWGEWEHGCWFALRRPAGYSAVRINVKAHEPCTCGRETLLDPLEVEWQTERGGDSILKERLGWMRSYRIVARVDGWPIQSPAVIGGWTEIGAWNEDLSNES